ncbi:hypothetical protein SHIRM173S_05665 [Streptomyces hirsutus]
MELQGVQELTNFFERRPSAYQVAVEGTVDLDEGPRAVRPGEAPPPRAAGPGAARRRPHLTPRARCGAGCTPRGTGPRGPLRPGRPGGGVAPLGGGAVGPGPLELSVDPPLVRDADDGGEDHQGEHPRTVRVQSCPHVSSPWTPLSRRTLLTEQWHAGRTPSIYCQRQGTLGAMLRNVAAVLLDRVNPFELGVVCEVFGVDRSDDGLPVYDFAVASAEGPSLRSTRASRSRSSTAWTGWRRRTSSPCPPGRATRRGTSRRAAGRAAPGRGPGRPGAERLLLRRVRPRRRRPPRRPARRQPTGGTRTR